MKSFWIPLIFYTKMREFSTSRLSRKTIEDISNIYDRNSQGKKIGFTSAVQTKQIPTPLLSFYSFELSLRLFTPLVLLTNLCLLLGAEIIGNVESLADLLGCLSLDHTCHGGTCQIQ